MSETLAIFTAEDAESILGRPLEPGEASSIRKTIEGVLSEAFTDAVLFHDTATTPDEAFAASFVADLFNERGNA